MKPIFVHIPKTGGTTLRTIVFGDGPPICNHNYRHVSNHSDLISNSADIFDPCNANIYQNIPIIMVARDPLETIEVLAGMTRTDTRIFE